jgi:hypothetical protein
MPNICIPQDITLTGEVVETFEREDEHLAKIALSRMHLEVPMRSLIAVHLGDRLQLMMTITIQDIQPITGLEDTGA